MSRVVAVTGASSGIGLATARRFAAAGDLLVLNHLGDDPGPLPEVADAARAAGGDAVLVQADVSDREQAERIVRTAEERFGRLDVLVNNAGILRSVLAHETTPVNIPGVWQDRYASWSRRMRDSLEELLSNPRTARSLGGV